MKENLKIWRDKNGIPHIEALNESDMYWGQGYVHATDRGMQILLMRILGQGRVSELLDSSEESLKIDTFFRKMNWSGKTQGQIEKLSAQEKSYLDSYTEGINAAFSKKVPWEFKLMGYKPEKWTSQDCIMISRMIGYLTLAQSQAEMEKLFIEMVQANIPKEKLEELFPGILGGLDIELIKKVKLSERIVPPDRLWGIGAPRMMASNNWVVSGVKTASGKPILANDPHLEVNRLPNVWSEMVLKIDERYMMGGTMPGCPGVLVGRTPDLAWGATYSFADASDSWIEKCKDGKYYREEKKQWIPFLQRKEIVKRKKKDAVEIVFFENNHGTLEGDPFQEGCYLATEWAANESGAGSVSGIFGMWNAKSVEDGMNTLGKLEASMNFVFADSNGDIGYQMTGKIPKRSKGNSGFIPLPGWKKKNDWLGFLSLKELPRIKNPKEGFFVTANEDLNKYGKSDPINMPMGNYRADRISNLLEMESDLTIVDMKEMHYDVYSLQAEYFMKILKPLLPETEQGQILKDWDLKYSADSKGAYLFEQFYTELYKEVFGTADIGEQVVDFLKTESGIFVDFYKNFDRILLSEKSAWFNGKTREQVYKSAAERALLKEPKEWQDVQKFTMTNILFGGKLPAFLKFDRGPIVAIGSRATIHQGQIYRSAGRDTTFLPSLRIVTDFASDDMYTNLIGGPSDRRFSKWYNSDLDNWVAGIYKKISPDSEQEKIGF
ncbi:penicillin acylase family protein [candidate division KSB1 bacterium]|nr:penicillin acylase family protein [candidate division KSB1 bacterium]MBL7092764.1 penicillin acylase family protein [candidate division KSB1 bacterium]